MRKLILAAFVTACAVIVAVHAFAQGHPELVAGIYCDTAEQAAQFVEAYKASPDRDEALTAVNDANNKQSVCWPLQFVAIIGAELMAAPVSDGILHVHEATVVAEPRNNGTIVAVPPTPQVVVRIERKEGV